MNYKYFKSFLSTLFFNSFSFYCSFFSFIVHPSLLYDFQDFIDVIFLKVINNNIDEYIDSSISNDSYSIMTA